MEHCQKKLCPSLLLGGPMWHQGHMGSLSPSPSRISPLCHCQETELGSAHRCWMDHVSHLAGGTQAGVTHQLDLPLDPLSPSQRTRRRACSGRHNSCILDPEVETLKQAWAQPGQSNTTICTLWAQICVLCTLAFCMCPPPENTATWWTNQAMLAIFWQFLLKLKLHIPYNPAIPL